MAQRSSFSDVDASPEPDRLIAFLDMAARTLSEVKARMHASLGLHEDDRYLDVGCGVGHDIAADPRAVGIDRSVILLEEAVRRRSGLRVAVADAHDLPFAGSAFGGCRVERVLMHVTDPAVVLSEAARVLRPSGRIAVWEPDFESMLFDASDVEVSRAVSAACGDRIRQGRVGRALARLLDEAGFVDVHVELEPGWALSLDDVRRIFGFDSVIATLVETGTVGEARMRAWLAELDDRAARGVFRMYFSRFFATGRKP